MVITPTKKINYDYLRIAKELPFLVKLDYELRNKKPIGKPKTILIFDICLVGDFMATLFALHYFIKTNKTAKIDIVVSPPLKPLAEKIIGINKVLTVKSLFSRDIEKQDAETRTSGSYDAVLLMRISPEAYTLLKKIKFKEVNSHLKPYLKYMNNLIAHFVLKKQIKQWRDFNFELLGKKIKSKKYCFNELFNFDKSEYDKIKKLPELKGNFKKIIIHTGSGWHIKFWDNRNWISLLKQINQLGKYKFIFVGGTDDENNAFQEIQNHLDFEIYSFIKKMDLKEVMALMRLSDYFIGVDSGPRNMAHIAELPSINLLGPGPKFFAPLSKKDVVIDKSNCTCTNLFCYKKQSCMQKITVNEVLAGFKKLAKL